MIDTTDNRSNDKTSQVEQPTEESKPIEVAIQPKDTAKPPQARNQTINR